MKVKMKTVTVYGLKENRKSVMEFLQKKGVVEFKEVSDDSLEKINTADSVLSFERYISSAGKALEILDRYVPCKKPLLFTRKILPDNMFSMTVEESNKIGAVINSVISDEKKLGELKLQKSRTLLKIEAMKPWTKLDVPLSFSGTKTTKSSIYMLPYDADEEKIKELLGNSSEEIYFEIINKAQNQTCVFFTYLKCKETECEKAIREVGATAPPFSLSHLSAEDKIKQLENKILKIEDEEKSLIEEIRNAASLKHEIELFYDHICLRRDKYTALSEVRQTDKVFIIEGYAPEENAFDIKKELEEKYISAVSIEEIPEEEEAPVLLKNNGFAAPLEGITATYSIPSKFDIDPDFVMSLFYYLFFGMMFSDAGYGILVMLVTGYIAFFSKAEAHTKLNMRMFFFCGVSTTFWGFMYGSFFGDAVTQIGTVFFGHPEWKFPTLWMDPVSEPLRLLIFSVALGAIQIVTGLAVSVHTNWKKGDRAAALFDSGSWILIILGIASFAGAMIFKNGAEVIYNILYFGGIALIGLGILFIILMKGRASKNPILRLGSGILGLYDVTSYVSDALSYSRLMALGLSTGVIAQVINTMATLAGKSVVGALMFILIFTVGHAINFAINMLGAYVHTNRLQYVEFFSKFYEGGGRAFSPLKMNTKYYIFKEDK